VAVGLEGPAVAFDVCAEYDGPPCLFVVVEGRTIGHLLLADLHKAVPLLQRHFDCLDGFHSTNHPFGGAGALAWAYMLWLPVVDSTTAPSLA